MILFRTFSLTVAGVAVFAGTLVAQTDTTETTATPETTTPANSVQVGVGFDYSRGSYGFAEDTEVFSAPLTLTFNVEKWILRASVPYLKIEGPADAVGAGGSAGGGSGGSGGGLGGVVPGLPGAGGSSSTPSVINNPARPDARSESGLGDIMLGATRMLGPTLGPVHLDLTARVKLPTADDDKGLGTGGTDFYGQADFYYVGTRFIPFATLGYRVMGDSDRYELENGVYASAGSAVRVGDKTRVGASLDWRSRIVDGGDDATEVSVFMAHDIDTSWNLILYALAGMTDASPDFGMGGSVSCRF